MNDIDTTKSGRGAKRKMIGNGVPLSMGTALARAILEAQMQ